MKRKLLQFGDTLDTAYVFSQVEEEEDWADDVNQNLFSLQFMSGSYRAAGLDESLKSQKTITKRFVLFDGDYQKLYEAYNISQGQPFNGNSFLTSLIDYMYRTLRGGVKRLYAIMEDGSIRYTWAEANAISYSDKYTDPANWLAMSVDFIAYDPYWYEVNDGATFWVPNIPFTALVDPFQSESNIYQYFTSYFDANIIGYNFNALFPECTYSGCIIRDTNLINYSAACIDILPPSTSLGIYADACYDDECLPDIAYVANQTIPTTTDGCTPDGCYADACLPG